MLNVLASWTRLIVEPHIPLWGAQTAYSPMPQNFQKHPGGRPREIRDEAMRQIVHHLETEAKLGLTAREISKVLGLNHSTVDRALGELHRIHTKEWERRGVGAERRDKPVDDPIVGYHYRLSVWYHHANRTRVNHEWQVRRPGRDEMRAAFLVDEYTLKTTTMKRAEWGYRYLSKRPWLRRPLEVEGVKFDNLSAFTRTIWRLPFTEWIRPPCFGRSETTTPRSCSPSTRPPRPR